MPLATNSTPTAAFTARRRPSPEKPLLALAISARIIHNRWPLAKFMALVEAILAQKQAEVLILWAPGSQASPTYPGDDETAAEIVGRFRDTILAYPTPTLSSLVAALYEADLALTLDTGSLHIAAAAQKPMVALMNPGKSKFWYPWHTTGQVITSPSKVENIPVDEVLIAVNRLISGWKT